MMFLVGMALIAIAAVAFMAAKKRAGEAKLAGKPSWHCRSRSVVPSGLW